MNRKRELEKEWNSLHTVMQSKDIWRGVTLVALLVGSPAPTLYLPAPFSVITTAFITAMAFYLGATYHADEIDLQYEIEHLRGEYERELKEDELAPLNHILYRLFDEAGALLYIGITSDPVARIASHRADKWWWEEVADKRFEYMGSRAELEAAERLAIIRERPMYNITYQADRRFKRNKTPGDAGTNSSPRRQAFTIGPRP